MYPESPLCQPGSTSEGSVFIVIPSGSRIEENKEEGHAHRLLCSRCVTTRMPSLMRRQSASGTLCEFGMSYWLLKRSRGRRA